MESLATVDGSGVTTTAIFNYSQYVTSQTSSNVTDDDGNVTSSRGYVMLEADKHRVIIIAVIMAFTLIGNMTMILVLLCKRSRRIKRVNILLVNLAIGDLGVALFVNSTEIFFIAFGDWALGPLMCKISVYVQMICLSSTTNLLTSMSIDRYQVIVKPMQSLAKRPRIWLKIAISWAISLIFPIPQLFIFVQYNEGVKFDGTPRRICGSKGYTHPWQRKVYFTFTTLYILIVPMVIMLYCYVKIIRVVWIRAKNEYRRQPPCLVPPKPPVTTSGPPTTPPKNFSESGEKGGVRCGCDCGEKGKRDSVSIPIVSWARNVKEKKDTNDNPEDKKANASDPGDDLNLGSPRMSVRRSLVTASKRRAIIMTLSVVISFLVCHTPYFLSTLVRIYSDYEVALETIKVLGEFMVMVHSTLNPFLYGLFTLRQYHLKYILSLVTCSRRPTAPQGLRHRQFSDERHQLLNSVRSKLIRHSNRNASTAAHDSKARKTGRREQHPSQISATTVSTTGVTALTSSPFPMQTPPPSSILSKFRLRPRPKPTKNVKTNRKGRQTQNPLLYANADAIHLKDQRRTTSVETEHSEVETSTSPVSQKDFSSGSLIANTHVLKTNAPLPLAVSDVCRADPRVKHEGPDVTPIPKFSSVDECDVTRRHKPVPWTPQDDEFIIGGLTRV
ncbi:unnamed protein product [Lymnaea stagnalis]|uniref:G-protein coupled receptors family 1 profile domain-containing protein n=1 Tax=Lymnaea stagnalis TaxID=6523 RepID=A0AAV2IDL6_LYMST